MPQVVTRCLTLNRNQADAPVLVGTTAHVQTIKRHEQPLAAYHIQVC